METPDSDVSEGTTCRTHGAPRLQKCRPPWRHNLVHLGMIMMTKSSEFRYSYLIPRVPDKALPIAGNGDELVGVIG